MTNHRSDHRDNGQPTGSGRRVLVTGGAGFVGSNLVHHLVRNRPDWEVTVFDALTGAGDPALLDELNDDHEGTFCHGDVRDRHALVDVLGDVDFVVHLAAESHIDRSIHDSGPFVSTNVFGTQVLLDACRDVGGLERVIIVSTDKVYGPVASPDGPRPDESAPPRPATPYAATKAAADLIALAYHETFDLPISIVRPSSTYGPFQAPDKLFALFTTTAIEGRTIRLYGSGGCSRDWMHVDDLCSGLVAVIEGGQAGAIYNASTGIVHTKAELASAIVDALDLDPRLIQTMAPAGCEHQYATDATRLRDELGWTPAHVNWAASVAETARWYRDHGIWWAPLKKLGYRVAS